MTFQTQPSALSAPARSEGATAQCYAIHARPYPGLVEKVMGQISKRGLVPDRLHFCHLEEEVVFDLQVSGLTDSAAQHLTRLFQGLQGVETVLHCQR